MLNNIENLVSRVGKNVTYRRFEAGSYDAATGKSTRTHTDYTVTAFANGFSAKQFAGTLKENQRSLSIAGNSLPFAPEAGDRIKLDSKWWCIIQPDIRYIGEDRALYVLKIEGV